jgi:NAD(P)-dependent dehydrogenase (short-subunit alcohol dehydrogenase family)
MKELNGRVAVVTGAASGIGRALAARFAAAGMSVALADVERGRLDAAVREIGATGAPVAGIRTDVSRLEDVEALADRVMERFGAVHVVANIAGVESGAPVAEIPLELWSWVMGVNFWGTLYGCRVFLPLLRQQPEGHIVNASSVAALFGNASTTAPYVTSKAAILGLSETLRHELAEAGEPIGVSVLVPGPVDTRLPDAERNLPDGVPAMSGHPARKALLDMLRGLGASGLSPEAVAAMVVAAIAEDRFYILTHPEHAAGFLRPKLELMGIADSACGPAGWLA